MPLYNLALPTPPLPDTSTIANPLTSNVLVAGTAKLIAPANTNRRQLTIFNSNAATVYFGYDSTVTASNYAFKLAQDGYFELPNPIFTGNLHAFCASANTLSIVEFI